MPINNDVEVEECEYFWNTQEAENLELCKINFQNNYFSNGIPLAEKCKKQLNCYFKQLQRLKKENEELKEKLTNYMNYYGKLYGKMNKIAFEHVTYKNTLEEIREMCKRQDFNQGMRTFEILKLIDEVLK